MQSMFNNKIAVGTLAAASLFLAACSSDDAGSSGPASVSPTGGGTGGAEFAHPGVTGTGRAR